MFRSLIRSSRSFSTIKPVLNVSKKEELVKLFKDNSVVKDSLELVKEMERRRYNVRWIGLSIAGVGTLLFFGAVRDWFTDQASEITTRYLKNETFQKNVVTFVEGVISQLASSPSVQENVNTIVIRTTKNSDVQQSLIELFTYIFQTDTITSSGTDLSKVVAENLVRSDGFQEVTKTYATNLVLDVLADPIVQNAASNASWNVIGGWFGSNKSPNIIVREL